MSYLYYYFFKDYMILCIAQIATYIWKYMEISNFDLSHPDTTIKNILTSSIKLSPQIQSNL